MIIIIIIIIIIQYIVITFIIIVIIIIKTSLDKATLITSKYSKNAKERLQW